MIPRVATKATTQYARQTALAKTAMLSSIHPIHTRKQQHELRVNPIKSIKASKPSTTSSSRWLTAAQQVLPSLPSLPSLASSISPQSVIQSIGKFTGSQTMSTQNDRVMQRFWETRKKKLYKSTRVMLEQFQAEDITFDSIELYIRASGSFDSEDEAQRDVHIALRGIAHTSVVLRCGTVSYLLDRVVEGIRLTPLEICGKTQTIIKCNKFKPREMLKIATFNDINLPSAKIAEWIDEESQTQYHVMKNNCVWFSFYFYQRFLYGLKTQRFMETLKSKMSVL